MVVVHASSCWHLQASTNPIGWQPTSTCQVLSASSNCVGVVLSVSQACNSPIDFDYLEFHKTRLGEYRRRKDAFHAEACRVFA